MANHIQLSVGRLIEVRLEGIRSVADVDAWFDAVGAELAKVPLTERAVVAADWRNCPLLSGEVAEHAVRRLSRMNPRVERSAALVTRESAVSMLQLMRVIRESHHPSRRLFQEPELFIAWLAEVLSPPENARLLDFIQGRVQQTAT